MALPAVAGWGLGKWAVAALGGALGWAYLTRDTRKEAPETVGERITTNLGSAVVAGATAAAIAWIWRRAK